MKLLKKYVIYFPVTIGGCLNSFVIFHVLFLSVIFFYLLCFSIYFSSGPAPTVYFKIQYFRTSILNKLHMIVLWNILLISLLAGTFNVFA